MESAAPAPSTPLPAVRIVSTAPLVAIVEDAVAPEICETLIAAAKRKIQPSIVTSWEQTMHNYNIDKRMFAPWADAEAAAIGRVAALVETLLQCAYSPGETRTMRWTEPSASTDVSLGLHVDTNLKPRRFATALLYLRSVPRGGGGETIWPLAGLPPEHKLVADAAKPRNYPNGSS